MKYALAFHCLTAVFVTLTQEAALAITFSDSKFTSCFLAVDGLPGEDAHRLSPKHPARLAFEAIIRNHVELNKFDDLEKLIGECPYKSQPWLIGASLLCQPAGIRFEKRHRDGVKRLFLASIKVEKLWQGELHFRVWVSPGIFQVVMARELSKGVKGDPTNLPDGELLMRDPAAWYKSNVANMDSDDKLQFPLNTELAPILSAPHHSPVPALPPSASSNGAIPWWIFFAFLLFVCALAGTVLVARRK